MSFELFKATLKRNWVMWIIFYGVLLLYLLIMISIFNPDSMQELNDMLAVFPVEIQKSFGFSSAVTDLTSYLASWLYGMLMTAFPMVYCIILGNRLVAKMVDDGSFAYLLSTPNSRTKIIVTQGVYAIVSVFAMFAATFAAGVLVCQAYFPGELDVKAFFILNVTTMLLCICTVMICFFFSCLFNEAKKSSGFGAGIPIAFYLMTMLGNASPDLKFIKEISIYGFFDPVELVNGAEIWQVNFLYFSLSLVLFSAGVVIFKRKRLPL